MERQRRDHSLLSLIHSNQKGNEMDTPILRVENVSKVYSGVTVLDDVSLEIYPGEIHSLCGENGAGKSTLIKILTGAITPASGRIFVDGKQYDRLTPRQSMDLGIAVIYQEFSLIPFLTVTENIFYGREKSHLGLCSSREMRQKAIDLCNEMGIELDVDMRVKDLGIAYQQIVEILKAVSLNSRIIIMDEPTAPLTVHETAIFFRLIRRLKEKGTTIIFISHRLEEVFEICDRVTVLCDGHKVLTCMTGEIDRSRLVAAMVGREITNQYPAPSGNGDDGETILEVEDVSNRYVHDICFSLHKGEILGFGGLIGAGRTEVMRILFGLDPYSSGSIRFKGKPYRPRSTKQALDSGIGLIPEDRKRQGIVPCRPVRDNICLSVEKRLSDHWLLFGNAEKDLADESIRELNIKTSGLNQLIRNLSGGNQQKAVLAKMLATNCDVLIFDEPTRGIDVGAKQEIYELMVQLVKQGKSIIMVSSEMPELIGMSDRIIVMGSRTIQGELRRGEYTQERILDIASR